MLDISRIVRSLRRKSGLTQVELAGRAGVSQSTISLIEQGKMQPSPEVYTALVGAMGMELDFTPKRPASPGVKRLSEAMALLSEDEIERLAAVAEHMGAIDRVLLDRLVQLAIEVDESP